MNRQVPKDPAILLSYVNTQLRDSYSSLEEFCAARDISGAELESVLGEIGYFYDPEENRFR